ncbi:uncharacterized protein LOC100902864 [Galendromus occidentalis]|uniref:Uncharacterized protein LOC100902864 n=1 Tax=Galendromus occidentalis TaxID=34638 RepID=A0AAJ6QNC2_9ACAR|nr:uncharacterized protein LOC100902864 [Galendromus occidentalis]
MGNQLTKNQLQALAKKEEVLIKLEGLRELRVIAEQYAKNDERAEEVKAKKAEKAITSKILDVVAQVLRLQALLDEGLKREEIEDNEVLGMLRTASLEARGKNYRNAARFWLQVVEAKPKEFAEGVTFQAAHEKLMALGSLLEKLDEVNLNEGEEGGRGESPFTSSVGESEPASDHQASPQPNQPSKCENSNKQQDEVSDSPTTEDPSTPNNGMESQRAAEATPRHQETQPNIIQNSQQHLPPRPPAVVPHATVAVPEHPHHQGGQQIVIPGISLYSVSPVQPGDDAIQFGSVEHVVHHPAVVHSIPATALAPTEMPSPNSMFVDREFDFIQDDLTIHTPVHQTAAVHMDPAVVYAAGATENGEGIMNGEERSTKAGAAAGSAAIQVKEASRNGYSGREDKERRSPQDNHRHSRGGEHEGGKGGFYRGMNGNKGGYNGDSNNNNNGRWTGHRSGHWNNRDRREGGYNGNGGGYGNGHSHSRHSNAYGGGNNGNPRNNSARREPTAQRV